MEKVTLISEMHKYHFGSKVICNDGEEGVLTHVVFEAGIKRLSAIGVRLGRFFGKSLYLPATAVIDAAGSGVTLNISRSELMVVGKTKASGTMLDSKSSVQLADSQAKGGLLLVASHPQTGELAYIVAHDLRSNQDNLLPQEYITKLENNLVVVTVPEAVLQTLASYRSDAELQQEVEDILFDLTPLHVDFKGMNVRVLDSVLYLDGNISSSLRGDIVQSQASGVQGLLEIKNHLVGDDKLAGELAMVLSHDSRTHNLPIGVYPRLGDVRLGGAVHTEEQKRAAEEIARAYPGVRSVTNSLLVDLNMDLLRVMSPAEAGEPSDLIPGKYIRHTK